MTYAFIFCFFNSTLKTDFHLKSIILFRNKRTTSFGVLDRNLSLLSPILLQRNYLAGV